MSCWLLHRVDTTLYAAESPDRLRVRAFCVLGGIVAAKPFNTAAPTLTKRGGAAGYRPRPGITDLSKLCP
ncbi:hypothetical protein GCM10011594_36110 [Nakamurella endophytica]|uniref:Uncharacterized protein n=1 Tax=Nakamurella endophytica TaxID=1748367 RepID=A0A917T9Y0_9ACTN|nr:hypothetical protein GCM10011594_36110 [Nakamurella endophytica]